jgi:hypothetical protein
MDARQEQDCQAYNALTIGSVTLIQCDKGPRTVRAGYAIEEENNGKADQASS